MIGAILFYIVKEIVLQPKDLFVNSKIRMDFYCIV